MNKKYKKFPPEPPSNQGMVAIGLLVLIIMVYLLGGKHA